MKYVGLGNNSCCIAFNLYTNRFRIYNSKGFAGDRFYLEMLVNVIVF